MNPLVALSTMDMLTRRWNGGHDRMLSGLDSLMGAIGVTITTDKSSYKVGDRPTYRISGAVPGSTIAWTSYKNGNPTGEYQADYPGEDIGPSGTATLTGSPFSGGDVGDWEKQILVIPPGYDGTDESQLSYAQVFFGVSQSGSASASTPATSTSATGGFLSQQVNLPLIGKVPVIAVAGVGVVGLLLLMGSSGSGRR